MRKWQGALLLAMLLAMLSGCGGGASYDDIDAGAFRESGAARAAQTGEDADSAILGESEPAKAARTGEDEPASAGGEGQTEAVEARELTIDELEQYRDDPEIVEKWLGSHELSDYLTWETVASSAVSEAAYAPWPYEALGVRFVSSPGRTYVYYGVPYSVYDELIHADSVGRYFNAEIKGKYDFEKFE
ncbi:MAG: KTSC domain-containing protein [Oscillospiraceae bacterium]|nr:KTSC domain-containing protein [Oscillospiraceae bacterium]